MDSPAHRRTAYFAAGPLLLGACMLALSGCDEAVPTSKIHTLKLTDHDAAQLLTPASNAAPLTGLIDTDTSGEFSNPAEHWLTMVDTNAPFGASTGELDMQGGNDAEGSFLTLSGARGAAYRLVPAQPSTCYSFSALVRSRELKSEDDPFFGATTWIAELTKAGTAEQLLGEDPTRFVFRRELFETTLGTEDWQRRERLFVTGPETRVLLVVLCLSFTERVDSGAVDFRSVRLDQLPDRAYWETRLAWAAGVRALGEAESSGWRQKRLVRGFSGAEMRPSIVCFPGDRLRFEVDVPGGSPRLEVGVSDWNPGFPVPPGSTQTFTIEVGDADSGAELRPGMRIERPIPERSSAGRWEEGRLDLSPWAGRRIALEFSVKGELPGMFGAPLIASTPDAEQAFNVLLVSIDTLRADHVGCYGAPGNPTPNIDAFAAESLRFSNTVGQSPYTLPGHATLLSGQHPSVHGVQEPGHVLSPTRTPLLAMLLSAAGYRTQAFTGGGYVNPEFGFARGFDGFVNIDPLRSRTAQYFRDLINQGTVPLKRTSRAAQETGSITRELVDENGPGRIDGWLERHRDEPFFLFVHTFAIHDYDPPAGYLHCAESGCTSTRTDYRDFKLSQRLGWNPQEISAADEAHLSHLYDATLRYTDERFGHILTRLEELGLRENTIVVLTTDHGEEMFERGFVQHGKTLYEELTNLPLLISIPGVAPRVVEEPTMQVDLVPTLLAALGLPGDHRMQGIDLLARLASGESERATWSEIHDAFVHKYAYRSADGWKIIHAPPDEDVFFPGSVEWQLFDLNTDPDERMNLRDREPERFLALRTELEQYRRYLEDRAASYGQVTEGQLSESTVEQLNKLGYGGGE